MATSRPAKSRPFAIVTGASTGIGYYLAKECAEHGFDLLIAADEPEINTAADNLRAFGVEVTAIEADLATMQGVDKLLAAAKGRPVDYLLANAGRGLGRAFLDQSLSLRPACWPSSTAAWPSRVQDLPIERGTP